MAKLKSIVWELAVGETGRHKDGKFANQRYWTGKGSDSMKEFEVELDEIEKTESAYLVYGKSVGADTISLGDFLNDLEVVKIESYGHEVEKCPSGLTARLTLSFKFREGHGDRSDYLFLSLSEYKSDRSSEKRS